MNYSNSSDCCLFSDSYWHWPPPPPRTRLITWRTLLGNLRDVHDGAAALVGHQEKLLGVLESDGTAGLVHLLRPRTLGWRFAWPHLEFVVLRLLCERLLRAAGLLPPGPEVRLTSAPASAARSSGTARPPSVTTAARRGTWRSWRTSDIIWREELVVERTLTDVIPLVDSAARESSASSVGFWTCRANLVLLETARLVPLLPAWGTDGLPPVPGTCSVPALELMAGLEVGRLQLRTAILMDYR